MSSASDLPIETTALAQDICIVSNVPQDLHTCGLQTPAMSGLMGRIGVNNRRALLHAVTLAELSLELNTGRAHAVYLPMAIYTTATIHAAILVSTYRQGKKATLTNPNVSVWDAVWAGHDLDDLNLLEQQADTISIFLAGTTSRSHEGRTQINVADNLNGLYLITEQLRSYWGVATQMSSIVKQWPTIPSQTARQPDTAGNGT